MSTPSRRDRFRPLELLGLSGVVAGFVGAIVLMSTRQLDLTFIFAGVSFIVTLMTLAMLALTGKPTGEERLDMTEQDREQALKRNAKGDSGH